MNSISLLIGDLRRRLATPWGSVTFHAHLWGVILVCGGFEIWYQFIFKGVISGEWDCEAISCALMSYFPAIVSVAIIEYIHDSEKYLRSFGLLAGIGFLAILGISFGVNAGYRIIWGILGSVLAVLFWWCAVGEKDCFEDTNPVASTPDPRTTQTQGSTAGFRTS